MHTLLFGQVIVFFFLKLPKKNFYRTSVIANVTCSIICILSFMFYLAYRQSLQSYFVPCPFIMLDEIFVLCPTVTSLFHTSILPLVFWTSVITCPHLYLFFQILGTKAVYQMLVVVQIHPTFWESVGFSVILICRIFYLLLALLWSQFRLQKDIKSC